MKITLTGEESLRLEPTSGPLTIEAESPDQSYSPFHMLGSALGACTLSVLQSWASNKGLAADDLRIDITWTFLERQHRLDAMRVKLDWPSLSAELWPRAVRAAGLCGVHQTLTHPVHISIDAVGAESPAIVDWVDYEKRAKAADPIAFADLLDTRAGPGHDQDQVLGIFTTNGDFNLQSSANGSNIQIDASIATIRNGGTGGIKTTGSYNFNTVNIVGGRIQNNIKTINVTTRNVFFDRRFTNRPGFAPPWFPSTTVTQGGALAVKVTPSVQRVEWLNQTIVQ